MNDYDLAGLVSARICHDLASPVGAAVNGADLIGELPPGEASDELALVAQSAWRAAALLKFHRLAFGTAADAGTRISHAELQSRAEKALAGPRLKLEWFPDSGADISAPAARLAALLMLAGRAALPKGGAVRVNPGLAGDLPLSVQATGPQAGFSDQQRGWLRGDLGELPQPREVEFALIGPAASRVGAGVELATDTDAVTLLAALK